MINAKILMGMPIIIEVADNHVTDQDINAIYSYFDYIDQKFSTYKDTSEISKINQGLIQSNAFSPDMKQVFKLCEQTKKETDGYFDIDTEHGFDPSGLVKGWAVHNAANMLKQQGFRNFYIDAGGDIEVSGHNKEGHKWKVGIRNPFKYDEIVKVLYISNLGVATSGTAIRGQHVYNPKNRSLLINDIVSLTVIGPNIYEADRFATAAFAMGKPGINFIEGLQGFDGYSIDRTGMAIYTSDFDRYTEI